MKPAAPDRPVAARERAPDFGELLATFARIGVLSFGGPAAQIALMHRVLVDERRWLDEDEFLGGLSFCMLLPGPEAMQLATYAGWRLHGLAGGLAAGLLFVVPGALVVLALAMVYAAFGAVPAVEAVFLGIKAAVLVIVVEALVRVAKRTLKGGETWLIAALSFAVIFFLGAPFPLIVAAAAAWGALRLARAPTLASAVARPSMLWRGTVRTALMWFAVWSLPLLALAGVVGRDHILAQLAWFFSKLAVVTFGGAYAVLSYMAQDVVGRHGWLAAGEMMTGLGLAETTPGPLILVTEFVGFLAAYKAGGWAMGLAGAAVALWATFAPCFLWIFVGAPYVVWINAQPRLGGALAGITAAVVGVILNLAVWFGLHVLFTRVSPIDVGMLRLWTPDIASLDGRVVLLVAVSGVLLLWRHAGIPTVLAVAAALGLALHTVGL